MCVCVRALSLIQKASDVTIPQDRVLEIIREFTLFYIPIAIV